MIEFNLLKQEGAARRGRLTMDRGVIETPAFMPVGTYGTVKAMSPAELTEVGAQIVLGNTFHLWLRPGLEVLRQLKGHATLRTIPVVVLTTSANAGSYTVSVTNSVATVASSVFTLTVAPSTSRMINFSILSSAGGGNVSDDVDETFSGKIVYQVWQRNRVLGVMRRLRPWKQGGCGS